MQDGAHSLNTYAAHTLPSPTTPLILQREEEMKGALIEAMREPERGHQVKERKTTSAGRHTVSVNVPMNQRARECYPRFGEYWI